jgi:cell division protein FtsL
MALTQKKTQPAIDYGIERGITTRPTSTELVRGVRPVSLVNSTIVFAIFIFAMVCLYVVECAYLQSVTHTRDHMEDQYNLLKIQHESLRSAIINQSKQEVIQAWAIKHGMTLAPNKGIDVSVKSN